jgi:hypothetical protein
VAVTLNSLTWDVDILNMGAGHDDPYFVRIDDTLVGRKAGESAAVKARELRAAHPLKAVASRILGTNTDERAWSKGASGERLAGWFFDRLPRPWRVFHDLPIGERKANVDHLVVGPAGVFTVNTKNLAGTVRVTPRTLRVNGARTDFLPKAAHEADRASRLLSAALGRHVDVRAVLAIFADRWEIVEKPMDVHVGSPRGVKSWLLELPAVLSEREVLAICGAAHKAGTWRDCPGAGQICPCGGTIVERVRHKDGERFLGCSRFPTCRRSWPLTA